jgi:hydrogenase maturation protein HypF
MMRAGRRIDIQGIVQGVGFRPWIYRLARETGVTGRVRNDAAGVTIEAFGTDAALDRFVDGLAAPPRAADIQDLRTWRIPGEPLESFVIDPSVAAGGRRVSIPAELATCADCVAEIFDPANRRFRYPFTNCTACGPRFTIARDVPYDRAATTMAAFTMCPSCRVEYDDPRDRRFHAQPNACPTCGPSPTLMNARGEPLRCGDPIAAAATAIADGLVVAVKGLGGYHLACDATLEAAVQTLRTRKHRDEKPFAVMVRDATEAAQYAVITPPERELLESMERPIVIVRRRDDCALSPGVAPRSPLLGLLLPYTPLHHLLMHEVARPIVLTSGNIAEEPLVYRDEDAVPRLGGLADLLLVHDRVIETRCDDSVARVVAGAPMLLRRSRGYVPRAVRLRRVVRVPILACGALLKNTFCIAAGDAAVLGPHIGDLENVETYESLGESIERMCRFLGVTPEVVAHDLHPDYLSTRYALGRPETRKVGVQHHHAHIVSAMAEHGLEGPVLGVAFDGTGYGTDGAAWGGEIMVARAEGFDRVATLRPVRLAGGDAAIRHPWRIALALLDDAFDGQAPLDAFPLFSARPFREVATVRAMMARPALSPRAHGAGRYFDGIGALALGRSTARYEGQIALELNAVAEPAEAGRYEYAIDGASLPWQIDLRPMVRQVAGDLLCRTPAPVVSARFHNTLIAATADAVRGVLAVHGRMPIVLTGGCFQNPRLTEGLVEDLSDASDVHLHRRVPPGDGGIALGQAVAADAIAVSSEE